MFWPFDTLKEDDEDDGRGACVSHQVGGGDGGTGGQKSPTLGANPAMISAGHFIISTCPLRNTQTCTHTQTRTQRHAHRLTRQSA